MTAEDGDGLERQADEARARLFDTVVRLERQARGTLDVPRQLARSARRFTVPVGALAVVGIVALMLHGAASRKSQRVRDRWRLMKTLWSRPDRELRAERGSFSLEIVRSLLMTLATSALAIPLRHAARAVGDRAGLLAPKAELDTRT